MSSGTEEEAADRALSSVARKLDKALSVQYTVNQLVTDATHDDNLGIIYSGKQLPITHASPTDLSLRMESTLLTLTINVLTYTLFSFSHLS